MSVIDRLEVVVTFDDKRGDVGTASDLRSPVAALSLAGLRRRIDAALVPDRSVDVRLVLDPRRPDLSALTLFL